MSAFEDRQSPARVPGSVELAAGLSGTVGDSPAVAVGPSTDVETVAAEGPALAGEAPSTPTLAPVPAPASSPHVTFVDDASSSPAVGASNVSVVIRLPPLPAARQARDWCRRCLRFIGRDPSRVPRGFVCSFGNYSSCSRCRLQTHQRCEPV